MHQAIMFIWMRTFQTGKTRRDAVGKAVIRTSASGHMSQESKKKVRSNCSADSKTVGVFRNSIILTGLDLIQKMIGIKFRFNERCIATTCVFHAMFLKAEFPCRNWKGFTHLWLDNPCKQVKLTSTSDALSREKFANFTDLSFSTSGKAQCLRVSRDCKI